MMLTKEQVIQEIQNGRKEQSLDGRDFGRLCAFFDASQLPLFGMVIKDGAVHTPKPWTREKILDQLEADLDFGFEKALNQRGLSASAMHSVVQMWMWVLEDDLQHFDDYAQYGLPLFKAVALKYGFENPIGEDAGNEHKYASD